MEIFLRCLPFHAIQSKHKQAWTKQCVTELRVYFSPILFKTHRISVVFAFPLPLARSLEFQVNPFQVDILHRFDSAAFRHASESKWVKHFTNARRCVRMTELPISHLLFKNDIFPVFADDLITTSSSYDVRFDDAFWSAVEGNEESLTFSLKSNARLAASRETFVKTATVVATVYVDGNSVIPSLCNQIKTPRPFGRYDSKTFRFHRTKTTMSAIR